MSVLYTSQFKKDYKRIWRQHKDIGELRSVIEKLARGDILEPYNKDHRLSGQWDKHRECHITSDWLLIYRLSGNDLILERTGSHSDLFG